MLQKVCRLLEDLHALGALEGAVLVHHALVLVWVGQVRDVVPTGATLVAALAAHLQGGLLGWHWVWLGVLAVRRWCQGRVWLQDNPVDSTPQWVLCPMGESVDHWGRHYSMLLPGLRHPATAHVWIQF